MAKPITIYGRILSPFVARVVLAARAKGLAHKVEMPEGGIKSPEYLKLNPLGKMPVMKDGATVLFESGVIIGYLDSKSKAKKLLPSDPKKAAIMRLVGAVCAEYAQTPAIELFRIKRGMAAPGVTADAQIGALRNALAALEKVIPKGKFAGGSAFSHADCFAAPTLLWATRSGRAHGVDMLAPHPKLRKYWAAIMKDKTAEPVLSEMAAAYDQMLAPAPAA